MNKEVISEDMRVWAVLQRYPQTIEVFRRHGCPDMRKGIFAVSAQIMKIKWAAKVHKIPVDKLLNDLNSAIKQEARESA